MAPDSRYGRLAQLRDPIERGFGRFGRFVYRRAWPTIAIVLVCVVAFLSQLPRLRVDTSTESLFPKGSQVRATYDDFRERYGRDQAILLAIETSDVFELGFLEKLRALHDDLEAELPHLQEVSSLINIRSTRGEGDELIVEDLLENWPENAEELALIRERVRSNPLYVDQIISGDERYATIVIKPNVYSSQGDGADELAGFDESQVEAGSASAEPVFLTGAENTEIVQATQAIIARHDGEGFRIMMAGVPVMVDEIMRVMLADMARFTALALATIALFLAVVFRRVAAVLLPLSVSGLAMVCTMSLMAILDIAVTTTTQIVPSFLLAVGVGSAVHILSIFYQAESRGESKEASIAFALEHSGLAVVMTGLTTAGGMLSFVSADIVPMVELGIMTAIGILAALLFSLILLPALIAVCPMWTRPTIDAGEIAATRRALMRIGDWSVSHARPMVAGWMLLLGVSILGATKLEVSNDPIGWFPEEHPLRIAMERMNEVLGGTMFIEAVVDTGRENGVQDPDLLRRIEALRAYTQGLGDDEVFVGKTIDITNVVKETHQALNENRSEFYVIPEDKTLIAQELLLFENGGADDLEKLVDSQFMQTRITMKMPFADATRYSPLLESIEREGAVILGDQASLVLTGESMLMTHTLRILVYNLIKTYTIAFIIITPLMMILLGSLRMGLVSMVPNLAPVVITLGIMGHFGIPLEVFTLLIGSIALGLAVDDTVHFMHNFRRSFERTGDPRVAVRETLSTTGQALLFTTIVLSSGFFIYMLATMANLFYFGMLTGITIILAFLADLLLGPALVSLLAERIMKSSVEELADGKEVLVSSRTPIRDDSRGQRAS